MNQNPRLTWSIAGLRATWTACLPLRSTATRAIALGTIRSTALASLTAALTTSTTTLSASATQFVACQSAVAVLVEGFQYFHSLCQFGSIDRAVTIGVEGSHQWITTTAGWASPFTLRPILLWLPFRLRTAPIFRTPSLAILPATRASSTAALTWLVLFGSGSV